jgi:hypothetical protein
MAHEVNFRQSKNQNSVVSDTKLGLTLRLNRVNNIPGFAGYPLAIKDRAIGVMATFSHYGIEARIFRRCADALYNLSR